MGWWGRTDAEVRSAMAVFSQGCANYTALLGLTPAQLAEITDANTNFTTTLDAADTAKAASKAAVAVKDVAKGDVSDLLARWSKTFEANPSIPLDVKRQLGIPDPKDPSKTTPKTPTALSAIGFSDGRTKLKWNKNGNIAGTRYFIEAKVGTGDYELIDVVTASNYTRYDAPVGVETSYRVQAKRRDQESGYSNTAVVWDGSLDNIVELNQAA